MAHALLQASEEVTELMESFPSELLWQRPANMASPGFHLQHLAGVLDRVFTYARNEGLTAAQFEYLAAEGKDNEPSCQTTDLVHTFEKQVHAAIEQLKATPEEELPAYRSVGRAALPSTVIGLLVHGAEHTMRHVGQLLVTVAVIRNNADLDTPLEEKIN